jgi:hypothetical protein
MRAAMMAHRVNLLTLLRRQGDTSMKSMESILAQLTIIKGEASDVRQSRTTIMSNGGAWGTWYECLFRVSGKPVALWVNGPIFIEDGETVTVIGMYNQDGVFAASAYYNQSSGVSGRAESGSQWEGIMLAGVGGIMLCGLVFLQLTVVSGHDRDLVINLLSLFLLVLAGLVIYWGVMGFVRFRMIRRAFERLFNDAFTQTPEMN